MVAAAIAETLVLNKDVILYASSLIKRFFKKGTLLFSPLDRSLYISPPGRPVHSDTNSTSLGSIQPCCNILNEDYSLTFPQQFTARYSFIKLSELGPCRKNENAEG